MSAVAGKYHSRLQAENAGGIAPFEGKVGNLVLSKGMSEGGILRVDQRGRTTDFHRHGSAGDLHGNVQIGGRSHQKLHPTLLHSGEAWGIDGEFILRGRQFEKLVISLVVTLGLPGEPGGWVGNGQCRTRHDGAFRVVYRTAQ